MSLPNERQLAIELALRAALLALQRVQPVMISLGSRSICQTIEAAVAQAQAALGAEIPPPIGTIKAPLASWSRAMIMAATDLELRGRLAILIDRVGWEAQTIRAELRARADEAIRDNLSPANVISIASRFAKGDAP